MTSYSLKRTLFALLLMTLVGFTAQQARASHLRGQTISWAPTANLGEVEFTFNYSERYTASFPALGSSYNVSISFGDGSTGVATGPVTSINTTDDYFIAVLKVKHTYAGSGPYTAFYNNCCRISTIKDGHDQTIQLQTTVTPRNGNHSPVTSLPVVVTVVTTGTVQFTVPAADIDGDRLRFRLATSLESFATATPVGFTTQPPGFTVDLNTGVVTWNTAAISPAPIAGDLWASQIMIEDLDSSGNVKSKVPVDFILKFVAAVGHLPTITLNPTGPVTTSANTPVSFTVTGNDVDTNSRVTLNASGMPAGASMSPALGATLSPPVTSTFSWTPTLAQAGATGQTYVINFTATDDTNQQAITSITINVLPAGAPSASSQSVTATSGSPRVITLSATDPNGSNLSFIITGSPAQGTITNIGAPSCSLSGGVSTCTVNVTYTSNSGYSGPDSFSFRASNGVQNSNAANVSITVTKAATAIAVSPATGFDNSTTIFVATLSTTSAPIGPLAGFTVSFTRNGTAVGNATTNASGVAILSNVSLVGTAVGTYPTGVGASFAGNGNYLPSSGSALLTVQQSNQPPVATCQSVTVNADPSCRANALIDNGSYDPDAGDSITLSQTPSGPYDLGNTSVTLTVTDSHGSSSTCTANVRVVDAAAPVPDAATLPVVTGECSATIPAAPHATDSCAGAIVGTTTDPLTYSTQGTFTVTWHYSDGHGNETTQTQTVIVKDKTPPVVPNLPGSPQTFNWVIANTPAGAPSARTGHRMVYDPVRHKVILFGGHDSAVHPTGNYVLTSHLNDVWELDTATNVWTEVTPSSGPMPVGRGDFGMAYDVARNKVVIFGGEIDGWLTGDTWEWDPVTHTWEEKTVASVPVYGGLFGPAMAYDPNRHQVILFGGRAYYNWGQAGTYAWDGTNWIDVTPAVYPPPRFIHAMATDLARSKVILFGGKNNAYPLTDTWEWDGSAWTQVIPVGPVPPAREDPSMAYDAARQVTVLFGGYEHSDNDTWSWNGGAWSLEHPQTSPSWRSTAIVYDSAQSKLVLFSGDLQSDTWYSQTTSGLPTITGECSATVTAPVATDNCSGSITGTTSDPTTYNSQGTYTIHWTYDDGHGNTSTQTQTVIVKDTTAPVPDAAALPDITSECSSGLPPAPTATDNCDGHIAGVPNKTGPFGQGDDVITWTFTDHAGNVSSQTQAVHVHDTTPPQVNGLGSDYAWFNVNGSGPTPPARVGHQMVYDSARKKVILFGGQTIQGSLFGGQTLPSNSYLLNDLWEWDGATRTWTQVTPASGPTPSPRSFFGMAYDPGRDRVVLYGGKVDAIYYSTNSETWEWDPATRTWTAFPAAGDINFGGMRGPQIAYDSNLHQPILFGGIMYWGGHNGQTSSWDGTHWILRSTTGPTARIGHAMATDFARNRVVLFGGYDYTGNDYAGLFDPDTWEWNGNSWTRFAVSGPGIRIGDAMSVDNLRGVSILFGGTVGGNSSATPVFNDTWEWNGASWLHRPMLASPGVRDTALAFDGFTTLMFGGRNDNGPALGDTWIIQQSGSADITVDADNDRCSAVVNFATPTATDNCGTATVVTNPASGSNFPVGTTPVTVTATDANGNSSTATFNVTVRDHQAPTPDLATLPSITGECSATIPAAPHATDNCAGTIVGITADPLTYSTQGTFTVTWHFDDGQGNESTQTQTVIVKDVTKPAPNLASLPDVTGECSATIPSAPTASDDCAGTITGMTNDPLTYSSQGIFVVHWIFDDGHGNISTQDQNVIVKDVTRPVPNMAALPDVIGECSATIPSAPMATDNCAGSITGTTTDPLAYTEQGTFTVTWHYSDGYGNESTQTQTVIVKDITPPALNVPVDVTVNTGAAGTSCSALVPDSTIGSATATDNCEIQSLVRTGVPGGNIFPVGMTVLTYTATDIHGKVTTKTQRVTVVDDTIPVLNVPPNITIGTTADASSCTAFVANAMLTPSATDNCGVDVNSFTRTGVPAGNNFPVGTTIVSYTVKDVHGNMASGTQSVTVTDATLPVITFTGKTITLWPPDHKYQTIKITDLIASATDNCDPNVSLSQVVIAMVTSDEPENINSGDGNTFNDIVIAPDCKSVDLRAERDGSRNGRVYTIYFRVKDSAGNVQTVKATVAVPKSQGPGGASIDDTPAYPLPPPYKVIGSCPP